MTQIIHHEDTEDVIKVLSYDGQVIWGENRIPLYEVGNFLGGGAAGTVYEAENVKTKERYALKILNPIGYKLLSPALLRRCNIISKGKPVSEHAERSKESLTKENIWWVLNGSTKQYLAAYYSEKQRALNELSLLQCMQVWGSNPHGLDSASDGLSPGKSAAVPTIPPKYVEFLRKRDRIFREINNMRKISPHINVIRLEHVLELAQDSKCTIFLVMELANGGELFDRIKIDCGTREKTAKKFFLQLLAGVRHCHDEGVCHRDLKPENLLLQDISSSPDGSILKIADFGFSARVVLGAEEFGDSPHHLNVAATLRSVVGSPFYVAPEVLQAQPQGYDGLKADAWSLGVILYAMLAGNLPFAQELSTCRRFKQFGIWAAEQCSKSSRFWEDPNLVYPSWLFTSKFSPLARSLIVAFLLPDPNARISVSDSQKHPWCRIDEEESNAALRGSTSTESLPFVSPVVSPLSAKDSSAFSPSNSTSTTPHASTNDNNFDTSTGSPPKNQKPPLPSPSALSMALQGIANGGVLPDQHPKIHDGQTAVSEHAEPFVMDDTSDDGMEFDEEYRDKSKAKLGQGISKKIEFSSKPASESVFGPSSIREKISDSPPAIDESSNDASGDYPKRHLTSPKPIPKDTFGYQRRNFLTPPPVPFEEVPYIVAGTPDLLSSLVYGHEGSRPHSSSVDIEPVPITPPLQRGPVTTGSIAAAHPPSFHDRVKKSTRFITSVPAHDVLETVDEILQQCRLHKIMSPIGLIGRVEVHWENYRLDVWGIADTLPTSPPACSLHLYLLPSSTPQSPARDFSFPGSSSLPRCMQADSPSCGSSTYGLTGPLYLVEFVRGQLEIFPFKRFYEWIRQRISELVKRDYAWDFIDQAGSPIRPSLLSESPRSTHNIASQYHQSPVPSYLSHYSISS